MPSLTIPERPEVTANSVAKEYFGKELEAHASLQAPVVVIVHDSCYGHRFSRPRSTKNALATIVERPERIHATLLGASAAYVRLGGRHAEGKYAPRPKHSPSQVRGIPFQIRKTTRNIPLTHPSVAFVHGAKWMEELQVMCDTAEGKLALNGKELVRPIGYGKDENGNALPKLHEGDLYLCAESLAAFQGCLGGVCDAIDTVFSSTLTKRAFVCIRPPGHHCSSNYPSGFCWLNNVHVGIAYAAMNHGLTHAAIIDFDLHHGDGSQNIAWDQNRKAQTAAKNAAAHKKTPIGYYSLHDINSYPCEWGDEEKIRNASLCIENAHGQSIWNVHLQPWKTHEEFWKLYETKYAILIEKARMFLRSHTARLRASGNHQPKAAVFISAGFDASEWEGAGMQRHSVNVPTEFYARFTADLVRLAEEDDLGVDGRIISVLEGGYSDRALTSGVLSHICGLTSDTNTVHLPSTSAADTTKYQTINNWTPQDNASMANANHISYATDWWALRNLEELEAVVAGRQTSAAKTLKDKSGNYSSPTHASTLKMTEHARERHSLSALQARLSLESEYQPPPPDVDWAVASYELSRVLIPGDRQTLSCTHEELNAEATKARRERQSTAVTSTVPDERMQLRDRRTKAQPAGITPVRASSRNGNRRTTIAALSDLPDPSMHQPETINGRARRRSSDASSILSSFQGLKLTEDTTGDAPPVPQIPTGIPFSRASSVIPDKTGKAVAVKKPRAAPSTKGPSKTKLSPRKIKASPALPQSSPVVKSDMPATVAREDSAQSSIKRESPCLSQDEIKAASKPDDMDHLANGMKKVSIKLKMPTAEEHAAKVQQRVLDDKQKKGRAPRKPLLPKTSKPATVKTPSTAVPESFVPIQPKPAQASIPNLEEAPHVTRTSPTVSSDGTTIVSDHATSNMVGVLLPQSQSFSAASTAFNAPEKSQVLSYIRQPQTPTIPDQVVHGPKPGPPTSYPLPYAYPGPPAVEQPQAPLYQIPQMSPDTASAPSMLAGMTTPLQRKKHGLPVFTSNSPIPFAVPPPNTNSKMFTEEQGPGVNRPASVWDIPDTPQQQ